MSLRFFKEDMPELHVIAAGSLLELALEDASDVWCWTHTLYVHVSNDL